MNRELPEQGNIARVIWPLLLGGVVYSAAAARAQTGWAPLAAAGIVAYGVNKAMVNQKDFLSIRLMGGTDLFPI